MNRLTPQQARILGLLRDAGTSGINSYGKAREVALQLPAVVAQLVKHGYSIKTRRHRDRSVTYYLLHTPEALKKAPELIARPQGWVPENQSTGAPPERSDLSLGEIQEKIHAITEEFYAARDQGASVTELEIIRRRGVAYRRAQQKILDRQQQTS